VVEGGCHCGDIAFAVQGWPRRALVCTCSICSMKGYVHWIVARDRFRLLAPAGVEALACYRFGTGVAHHYFCPRCGVAPFYLPRSDPDKIDVNLRCVRGIELDRIEVEVFDGRDWDAAMRERDPDS
jgi:hypothetical protein